MAWTQEQWKLDQDGAPEADVNLDQFYRTMFEMTGLQLFEHCNNSGIPGLDWLQEKTPDGDIRSHAKVNGLTRLDNMVFIQKLERKIFKATVSGWQWRKMSELDIIKSWGSSARYDSCPTVGNTVTAPATVWD